MNLENLKKLIASLSPSFSKEEIVKALEGALFLVLKSFKEQEEKIEKVKKLEGPKGERGESVTGPQGLKGDSYFLTEKDKKEIAGFVKVPIVEKIIEKTEVVREKPSVIEITKITNEIKEVAVDETPEQIRSKLEKLSGNERLDINVIRGLKELIEEIPERPVKTFFGSGKTRIYIKDLSSELDGVTKTFTIGTHLGIIGVWSSSSPFAFRPTVDYTEVGRTIVFDASIDAAVSLATGQTLIVQYLR